MLYNQLKSRPNTSPCNAASAILLMILIGCSVFIVMKNGLSASRVIIPCVVYFALRLNTSMLVAQRIAILYAMPNLLNLVGGMRDWMSGRYTACTLFLFKLLTIFLLPLFINHFFEVYKSFFFECV